MRLVKSLVKRAGCYLLIHIQLVDRVLVADDSGARVCDILNSEVLHVQHVSRKKRPCQRGTSASSASSSSSYSSSTYTYEGCHGAVSSVVSRSPEVPPAAQPGGMITNAKNQT